MPDPTRNRYRWGALTGALLILALSGCTAGSPTPTTSGGASVPGGPSATGQASAPPSTSPGATAQPGWTAASSPGVGRIYHTATLLLDGRVLVVGGTDGTDAWTTAELYDPISGSWTATGSMRVGRLNHTATLLRDGRVLVTGGAASVIDLLGTASAELYDPLTGSWTPTVSMATPRLRGTATLMLDGRVLVAGGRGNAGADFIASAELYDPLTGTWDDIRKMGTPRWFHTAVRVPDGRLLVAGGINSGDLPLPKAELYDPVTRQWIGISDMVNGRSGQTATLLLDGMVLVLGGGGESTLASAELFDPATWVWTATGSLAVGRWGEHTATLLADGRLLVAGGYSSSLAFDRPLAAAELYDPVTRSWTDAGAMSQGRHGHSATLLGDGRVLVVGGGTELDSAELYVPITAP